MWERQLANRYTKALFQTALEKNVIDEVQKDLAIITETYRTQPELKRLLLSPRLPAAQKSAILENIFGRQMQSISMRFISLLVQKNRTSVFPYLLGVFTQFQDERSGFVRGTVRTAVPLSESELGELKQRLEHHFKKYIHLVNEVDNEIIVGVYAQVGDTVLDGSVRGHLNRLRAALIKHH